MKNIFRINNARSQKQLARAYRKNNKKCSLTGSIRIRYRELFQKNQVFVLTNHGIVPT